MEPSLHVGHLRIFISSTKLTGSNEVPPVRVDGNMPTHSEKGEVESRPAVDPVCDPVTTVS